MTETAKYRLTVGEYDDLFEVGVYDTRQQAIYALGEFVMHQAQNPIYASRPVEYPKITEV